MQFDEFSPGEQNYMFILPFYVYVSRFSLNFISTLKHERHNLSLNVSTYIWYFVIVSSPIRNGMFKFTLCTLGMITFLFGIGVRFVYRSNCGFFIRTKAEDFLTFMWYKSPSHKVAITFCFVDSNHRAIRSII